MHDSLIQYKDDTYQYKSTMSFCIIIIVIFYSLMIAKTLKKGKWSGLQWENCERKSEVNISAFVFLYSTHLSFSSSFVILFIYWGASTYKVYEFSVPDCLSSLLPFCWVLFLSLCSQRLGWDAHRRKWVGFLDCVFLSYWPFANAQGLSEGSVRLHLAVELVCIWRYGM